MRWVVSPTRHFSDADKLSFVASTVLIQTSLYPDATLFSQTLIRANRQGELWST
jgi:hypothetical protein